MKRFGVLWFLFAGLATIQALVAFELLSWAWPLFGNQPLLGNGVLQRASELDELVKVSVQSSPRLSGMSEHYRWLFYRQMEGIEASLLAAATLIASSAITWVVVLMQLGARAKPRCPNDT